jgi:hypothetical protein
LLKRVEILKRATPIEEAKYLTSLAVELRRPPLAGRNL